MKSTLLTLRKSLPDRLTSILRKISDNSLKLGIRSFVIGATARDLIFEYVYDLGIRAGTEDIDFGIAVESWEDYEELRLKLIEEEGFQPDAKQEQRLWLGERPDGMRADIVPVGGVETPAGEIRFPPSNDFVMSTLGFREASENVLEVKITGDLTINVVSPAGLVLLKLIAYTDRPTERQRDIRDVWFVAANYLGVGNEDRIYSDDVDLLQVDNFDVRTVGARLLGRDLGKLLDGKTLSLITGLFEEKRVVALADIIARFDVVGDDRYPRILATFNEFRQGITETVSGLVFQKDVAEKVMREDRDVLRKMAKSMGAVFG